jgi:multidrug efflux system membrane fusion protein
MITRNHRIAALAGAALLLTGAGAAWHVVNAPAHAQASAAALPEVELVTVGERPVAEQRSFSGHIAAISQVDIRPLVSGTITGVHFKDGDLVRKGQSLFTIDPRPFQAALDRAAGDLKAAEAAVTFARVDFERAKLLIGNSVISQRDFDKRQQDIRDGDARVAVAQAVVDAARLDVEHANIRAPIDGRISRAEITLGNIVMAGAAAPALTRIVSVSPVYAEFDADEQSYLSFVSRSHGGGFPVDLALAGERDFTRSGRIVSVDNRLDITSGTIRVRALIDNPEGKLVPGLYARIRVSGSEAKPALLVDARAVNVDQDKKFTFVVGADGRVAYRELRLGDDRDGRRLVLSGLKVGERVVVAGAQAVKPGDQVKVIASEATVQ